MFFNSLYCVFFTFFVLGILYESAVRRNASFSPSVSSCECSLDLTDSHSDQEPSTNIEQPSHESTGNNCLMKENLKADPPVLHFKK